MLGGGWNIRAIRWSVRRNFALWIVVVKPKGINFVTEIRITKIATL